MIDDREVRPKSFTEQTQQQAGMQFMAKISEDLVLQHLGKVSGEGLDSDIVSLGMVTNVLVDGAKVIFSINVPAQKAQELEPVRVAAEKAVLAIDGVEKVVAILTGERKAGDAAPAAAKGTPAKTPPARGAGESPRQKIAVHGVTSIVAVASGKGGVGKSTTSVNLALGLQKLGKKVGILDADIYGPSMPRLLGITDKPTAEGRILNPMVAYGLKVMSIGLLVEEESPMIWRGPMVISALTQMLREVAWGELDILIVDMPPGTGDAQLTMAQQVPLAGAVIASTPQDIALIDARKGLNMFRKVEVPILGLIENMSTFICPKCGERTDIFGHGGARDEAKKLGLPFLGEVPLHLEIRTSSDDGTPVVHSNPDSPNAKAYEEIAAAVLEQLEIAQAAASGPAIVFD